MNCTSPPSYRSQTSKRTNTLIEKEESKEKEENFEVALKNQRINPLEQEVGRFSQRIEGISTVFQILV
jgi:hypothetical protein